MQTVTTPTAARYGIVQASKIIGEGVLNPQNDELGKIHDIVIDAKDGRVSYAVLSVHAASFSGSRRPAADR